MADGEDGLSEPSSRQCPGKIEQEQLAPANVEVADDVDDRRALGFVFAERHCRRPLSLRSQHPKLPHDEEALIDGIPQPEVERLALPVTGVTVDPQ